METNMQCPNCSNQIPNTAKKCGVCGASLDALPEPVKAWLPDWAKALLTGMGIGLIIFAFLGTAFYFFYLQPSRSVAPPPTETITMTVEPAQAPPTATVIVIETLPSEMPTLTPTTTPTQTPTPTEETEYCDAFEGIDMTVVYMDWLKGEPLEFYIKMPGGVPGLEKTIPGSPEEWTYRAKIGDYSSGSFPWQGTIDEVKIWNRTLSAEQIKALYENKTKLMVSQETVVGDVWKVCITPNDGSEDGTELCSNTLTIKSGCVDADGDGAYASGTGPDSICGVYRDCDDNNASICIFK